MPVDSLCRACESTLNLSSASLSSSYYYDSLPYCVIDAVFSIGVKYTSTQNVVKTTVLIMVCGNITQCMTIMVILTQFPN